MQVSFVHILRILARQCARPLMTVSVLHCSTAQRPLAYDDDSPQITSAESGQLYLVKVSFFQSIVAVYY